MTSTLMKWYEAHGRHEVFAAGKRVPLSSIQHSLSLDADAITAPAQTDLDALSIPKTAREEKLFAVKRNSELERRALTRSIAEDETYHLEMARLYRQQVLGEKPKIQIQPLRRAVKTRR